LKKINKAEIAKEIIKTKISDQDKPTKSPTVFPKRYLFFLSIEKQKSKKLSALSFV
jgi:hypothetical protein